MTGNTILQENQPQTPGCDFQPSTPYWAETHEVENQSWPLENYNLYQEDKALQEATKAHGAEWAEADLQRLGEVTGSAEVANWGFEANDNKPVFHPQDRYGRRVDEVRFHPAYHNLMDLSIREGAHAAHWREPKAGAHVARAAKYYLINQVEAGHCCPITMTSAAIPALKNQPELFQEWAPKILSGEYDPRNIHHRHKSGVTIGMAMTEKQGGSDVRRNSTRAYPVAQPGPGQLYELVGHKYFVSAPMCDAFLVLAQAAGGISCFLVPRWRDDDSKNPLQVLRLKNKMGNVSNASSETELRGAQGRLVGEEGRGVAVILEMVAMTRFDCMVGSSAGMRQAIAHVTHHCQQREAFGAKLSDQPLMQNVLADLILENEGALAFTMRIARSLDSLDDEHEKMLMRMGTAVGKYWICKRAPGHAYEAMECIGGSAVMEDSIFPRLFRESPVNAIWEGSGNVQCLDMLRALAKTPASFEAFMAELNRAKGAHDFLDRAIAKIGKEFTQKDNMEYRARGIVEQMALAVQASTLFQYGNTEIAEAFCAGRLSPDNSGWVYGTLPAAVDCQAIIERATPKV
ncbi:MAG: acyl-CoA dehydrogenase family protein [Candidatus Pelagadaptatus aseana]|uniref:acyl-CoA dehydrogenase family protein n=1 Tax=Candidatus Pelagadaptatus aseana TaxID=3120508 RepID=UPI0039B1D61F